MRKREGDGCPVAGALQLVGDKWTLLIVRDLAGGPRRTTELIDGLFPISSRTLVDRLRDMEGDGLVERVEYEGQPAHVEYHLTNRGLKLLPLVDALRLAGQDLGCNECEDRLTRLGIYCEACPLNEHQHVSFSAERRPQDEGRLQDERRSQDPPAPQPRQPTHPRPNHQDRDDSIVLL